MPKIEDIKNTKKMNTWCQKLQEKMNSFGPASEKHKVEYKKKEVLYTLSFMASKQTALVLMKALLTPRLQKNSKIF